MGRLGRVLGRLGRILERLGGVLEASWSVLGASWGVLERLGASWARLEASWGGKCVLEAKRDLGRSILAAPLGRWEPTNIKEKKDLLQKDYLQRDYRRVVQRPSASERRHAAGRLRARCGSSSSI